MSNNPFEATQLSQPGRSSVRTQKKEMIGLSIYGLVMLLCGVLVYFFPRKLFLLALMLIGNVFAAPAIIICLAVVMWRRQLTIGMGVAMIAWIGLSAWLGLYLAFSKVLYIT